MGPLTVDAALILAVGTSTASVLAAVAALVKTLRAPTPADVLLRLTTLENRVTGVVRWYADVRTRTAAQGVDLPPIPAHLLVSPAR